MSENEETVSRRWWKEAVVYQIYPRSFQDSNGDGIGDIPGIISRLDYLKGLGVDVVWLSPHYDSPNADNGYDIRDYRKVMAEFGTMADFDALLAGLKARGMRLIVDLVVNHSSDEHVWFVESRKSKDNPYRDYYIWRPGRGDGPPNDWRSYFSGSAWTLDPTTGEYYLHLFADKQPDLNWENDKVRAEVYDLMRFWLDKGVDGFRMDVIPMISKEQTFPDYPPEHRERTEYYHAVGPRLHEFLQEMNREVLSKYDVMTVGEAFGVTPAQTPDLVDERRGELNMIFNFDAVLLCRNGHRYRQWTLPELKAIYRRQEENAGPHCWNTVFLSNHDNARMVSSFGDDAEPWRIPSAKLLATMLMTLHGTPFIYQGDELGMTNFPFTSVEQYDDIAVRNAWKADVLTGRVTAADFLEGMARTSRDHARTPMQWSATPNGGFTTAGKAWLAVNPNYTQINAEAALADPGSVYHHYARLADLRRAHPALVYSDFVDLAPAHPRLFAYTRTLGDETLLILLNFSRETIEVELPANLTVGELLLGNLSTPSETSSLAGWEARVHRCHRT